MLSERILSGWAVVYLIHHPKTLAKAHAELDSVVNSDRMVTLSDKPKLPYMCAIVNEAQRMANLLPVNAIRKTIRDVRVRNYDIPKGTWMVPHICIILSNPKVMRRVFSFFVIDVGERKKNSRFQTSIVAVDSKSSDI